MTGEGLGDTFRSTGEGLGEGLFHRNRSHKSLILNENIEDTLFHQHAEVMV